MFEIGAGEFKAKCLKLMDLVERKHETIVITKHGRPVAKLVPWEEEPIALFGFMQNTLKMKDSLIEPIQEEWDAANL